LVHDDSFILLRAVLEYCRLPTYCGSAEKRFKKRHDNCREFITSHSGQYVLLLIAVRVLSLRVFA
jgi:hypothetical protein